LYIVDEYIRLIPHVKMTDQSYPLEINDAVSMCTTSQRAADVQSKLSPHVKEEPLDEQFATIDRYSEVDVSLTCLPLLHLH